MTNLIFMEFFCLSILQKLQCGSNDLSSGCFVNQAEFKKSHLLSLSIIIGQIFVGG